MTDRMTRSQNRGSQSLSVSPEETREAEEVDDVVQDADATVAGGSPCVDAGVDAGARPSCATSTTANSNIVTQSQRRSQSPRVQKAPVAGMGAVAGQVGDNADDISFEFEDRSFIDSTDEPSSSPGIGPYLNEQDNTEHRDGTSNATLEITGPEDAPVVHEDVMYNVEAIGAGGSASAGVSSSATASAPAGKATN